MKSWDGPSISGRRAYIDGTGASGKDQTTRRRAATVGFCDAHFGGSHPDKSVWAGGIQGGEKGSLSVTGPA
jgi:hypothetical protein